VGFHRQKGRNLGGRGGRGQVKADLQTQQRKATNKTRRTGEGKRGTRREEGGMHKGKTKGKAMKVVILAVAKNQEGAIVRGV